MLTYTQYKLLIKNYLEIVPYIDKVESDKLLTQISISYLTLKTDLPEAKELLELCVQEAQEHLLLRI